MPTMRHSTLLNLLLAATWIAGIAACTYLTVRDHWVVGVLVLSLSMMVGIKREVLTDKKSDDGEPQ